jgi:tetratricopeptide (TPR) repeat protein
MVLWGSLDESGELNMSVSFAPEGADAYEVPNGVLGLTDIHEIKGNHVESTGMETFQRALAWLLAGYRKYHAQRPDYDDARECFTKGLNALRSLQESLQDRGLIRAVKATLNLYVGNTLLLAGQDAEAAKKYRLAQKLSTVSMTPMFIEPVNNLAYVERKLGNAYPNDARNNRSNARSILETVTQQCDPAAETLPRGCAYVWYNLGGTYHDEADAERNDARARALYVQAGNYFQKSIDILKRCQSTRFERRPANCFLTHFRIRPTG